MVGSPPIEIKASIRDLALNASPEKGDLINILMVIHVTCDTINVLKEIVSLTAKDGRR
jgi:hypothetical protein